MSDVEQTIEERDGTHGEFIVTAIFSQQLKKVLESSPNWVDMPPHQKEAIHMICNKLGRICNGDNYFADHWHDIQGYAKLVEELCD